LCEPDERLTVQPMRTNASRARRAWRASCSRRPERDVQEFRRRFAVLEPFSNHAQSQRLYLRDGFIAVLAVAQDA
jgi:hypothetical protein